MGIGSDSTYARAGDPGAAFMWVGSDSPNVEEP